MAKKKKKARRAPKSGKRPAKKKVAKKGTTKKTTTSSAKRKTSAGRKTSTKKTRTTRKVVARKTPISTAGVLKSPEDLLKNVARAELDRMDNIARFRAVIRALGASAECSSCGFTGRYVQRQTVKVEPGSHYFKDKRQRMYLHLVCMQCSRVEIYCPEAIGMSV